MPEIRFKGFSGEWEESPLSKFISSLDAGVSVNSGDRPANKSEFGILKTSCVTSGFFEPNENKVVFKAEEINRLKEPVLENTIIISRMNTPALVGANAYISKSYDNYFLPDRLWAAKSTSFGDLKFIAYILGSYKGRLALSDLATGTSGSMKNISKPAVLRLAFHAPEKPEQTAIGNYFQKLDALINQHQKKHDKLSNIKKAMLEKMFPKQGETIPEIRFKGFSGDWEEVRVGEIAKTTIGEFVKQTKQNPNSPYPVFNGGKSFTGFYDEYNNEGDKILISARGANAGFVNYQKEIYWAGNSCYSIEVIDKSKYDTMFIFFSIKKLQHLFTDFQQAANIPSVSKADVEKFEIIVPYFEEQLKIGTYFKKLDALINQHQQQITKLNNIKQACLSKMFV